MIALINTSSTRGNGELVLFQPVLKTYPTCHTWLITAHISLGHLECHWKTFNTQMDRTHQLLQFLSQWPSAPTQLIATLQVELTNIKDIYISYKPIIIPAINLLNTDLSFDGHSNHNNRIRRSLLPFLGNALSWLRGTATTKDVNNIKKRVNQLIEAQSTQQETLVHIIYILNVVQYAAQVNRHSINTLMDKVDETVHYINNLYTLTSSLVTILSFYQFVLPHQVSLSEPSGFPILHHNNLHAYHGLCRCSYNWDTFTSCLTHHRPSEHVITHRGNLTTHIASTTIIWGHIAL